jgi:uncharacterized protein
MKKVWHLLVMIGLIIGLLPLWACTKEAVSTTTTAMNTTTASKSLEEKARAWVGLLVAQKFEEAVQSFDPTMTTLMPAASLQTTWNTLLTQVGDFKEIKNTRTAQQSGYDIVFVTCNFQNAAIDVKVVYDAGGKIAGLFFAPASETAAYNPPEYANTTLFTETEVTVGTEPWQLPATLTMPKGDGPFPAVILVHGSGPNDRDETIDGNKPFKDLAWGLASQNIAVLRYEKRTRQYPNECAAMIDRFTVQDETIDDAIEAVNQLSRTKGIDSKKIFVIGHSLGGMLAPRIAAQDDRIAGIIMMAGAARKLEDLMLEQTQYIAGLDGKTDDTEAGQIKTLQEQITKIKELDFSPGEIILGAGKAYWQDLEQYDPVTTAEKLTVPMLILQGERDYQVTMVDFANWSSALQGHANVTLKTHPDLNHLFITGSGKSTPAEYTKPGNVAQESVEDIAAWVKK